MVMDVRGAVDSQGNVTAWDYQVWTPTHSSRPNASGGSLLAGSLAGISAGKANQAGADRNANHTYDFQNNRVMVHWLNSSPIRASALRGLGSPQNTFANESFIDELATRAGVDPLEFRLRHLNDPRAKAVLEAAAKRAGWASRPSPQKGGPGETTRSGRGIAFVQYDRTEAYVAAVAEVEVNQADGQVRVKRVVVAHDCGLIINPDGLRNQIEGNVIQATSRTLKEEVKFDPSMVTSLDWTSYSILRFSEIPEVVVELINRPDHPAVGAGEATTSAIPAAIANAIFDAGPGQSGVLLNPIRPQGGSMRRTFTFLFLILAISSSTPFTGIAQEKIRIGVPLFPTVSFPVFIAHERGFFEKNGLKAEIIRINSEPTTYQALISGDIDATSGAPTGLVQSNLQGVPVVSLGSWDNLVSYTVATREKIDDLSQLKGKKIGINRLGGKSSLVLRVMLEDAGLNTTKDVTLLQLGGSQERLAALMRGGIDAAPVDFAFEPKMKQLGFFLVTGKKTPFMNGPITVKVSSLHSNRSKWVRFVKSYLEATHYMTTNKEGSVEVLRRAVGIEDKETLDHAYEQMRTRADVDLIPPDAAVDNLIKMMTYIDKRASSVDRSKLADYSILKELGQGKPAKK